MSEEEDCDCEYDFEERLLPRQCDGLPRKKAIVVAFLGCIRARYFEKKAGEEPPHPKVVQLGSRIKGTNMFFDQKEEDEMLCLLKEILENHGEVWKKSFNYTFLTK